MKTYTERIAKFSLMIFLISIITALVGYAFRIFLARSLSVEEFGLFYSVMALVAIIATIKDLGLGSATTKFISEYLAENKLIEIKNTIVITVLIQFILGLFLFIPLFLLSDNIAVGYFHNYSAKIIFQILLIEIIVSVFVIKPVLQGFQKLIHWSLFELLRVSLILLLLIILTPFDTFVLSAVFVGSSIVVQIIFGSYALSLVKNLKGSLNKLDFLSEKPVINFAIVSFFGSIAFSIFYYTDTIIITYFKTMEEVGLYQLALSTSQILLVFAGSITAVLYPVISEMWAKKEKENIKSGLSSMVKMFFIFIIPVSILMLAFPENVIMVLAGEKYLPASGTLQILSLVMIFNSIFSILQNTSNGIGKPEISAKSVLYAAIINIFLSIIFVNIFGIIGIAISLLISNIAGIFIINNYMKRYIEIYFDRVDTAKIILCGLIFVSLIFMIKSIIFMSIIEEVLLSIVPAFIIYIFLIKKFRVINKKDIEIMKNMKIPFLNKFIDKIF